MFRRRKYVLLGGNRNEVGSSKRSAPGQGRRGSKSRAKKTECPVALLLLYSDVEKRTVMIVGYDNT